ncbi:MAG: hypothetical protein SGBAC_013213 [Bacillariaceae sp.]
MEGFSTCQESVILQRDESKTMLMEIDSPQSEEKGKANLVMDLNPMDLCTHDGHAPEELMLVVMLYNLALSYHLFASSTIGEVDGKRLKEHGPSKESTTALQDSATQANEKVVRLADVLKTADTDAQDGSLKEGMLPNDIS